MSSTGEWGGDLLLPEDEGTPEDFRSTVLESPTVDSAEGSSVRRARWNARSARRMQGGQDSVSKPVFVELTEEEDREAAQRLNENFQVSLRRRELERSVRKPKLPLRTPTNKENDPSSSLDVRYTPVAQGLKNQIDRLKSDELDLAESEWAENNRRFEEMQSDYEKELDELEEEIVRLKEEGLGKDAGLESLRSEGEQARQTISVLQQRVEKLENEKEKLRSDLAKNQEDSLAAGKLDTRLQESSSTILNLQSDLAEKVEELEKASSLAQELYEEKTSYESQISALKKDCENLLSEKHSSEIEMDNFISELKTTKEEHALALDANGKLKKLADGYAQDRERLRQKIRDVELQLEESANQKSNVDWECERRIGNMRSKVELANDAKDQVQRRLAEMESENANLMKENSELRLKSDMFRQEVEDSKQMIENLTSRYQKIRTNSTEEHTRLAQEFEKAMTSKDSQLEKISKKARVNADLLAQMRAQAELEEEKRRDAEAEASRLRERFAEQLRSQEEHFEKLLHEERDFGPDVRNQMEKEIARLKSHVLSIGDGDADGIQEVLLLRERVNGLEECNRNLVRAFRESSMHGMVDGKDCAQTIHQLTLELDRMRRRLARKGLIENLSSIIESNDWRAVHQSFEQSLLLNSSEALAGRSLEEFRIQDSQMLERALVHERRARQAAEIKLEFVQSEFAEFLKKRLPNLAPKTKPAKGKKIVRKRNKEKVVDQKHLPQRKPFKT